MWPPGAYEMRSRGRQPDEGRAPKRCRLASAEMLGSVPQASVPSTGALLVRGSALRVLTLVASVAVSFFLMPFLIHALGDRWYGMWALIGSITSYYALLDLGLTSAVNRFLTRAIAREEETDAN